MVPGNSRNVYEYTTPFAIRFPVNFHHTMADTGVLFSPSLFDEDDLFGDAIYGASTEPTELPLPDIPNSSDAALHAVVSGNDYNDDKVGPVDPRDDGTLGEDISHEDILALLQALDEVPSPVEKYTDAQMLELLNATCPTVPSTPTTMFPLDLYKTFRTSSEGSSCSSSPASEGSSSSSEALPFPDPGPERGPEDPIEAHLRVSKKTLAVIEGMFEPGQLDELRESVSVSASHWIPADSTQHNGARLRIESRPRHDVHIDLLVLPNMTTIISVIGWSHVSVVDLDWIFGRSTGICLPPLERLPVEPNYQPRLAQPSPPHLPAQLALPAGDLTYETSGGRKRKEREDDDDEPVVSTRRRSETRLEPSPSTVTMTVDLLESIVTDMNRFNWVGRNTVKWFCVTWERKVSSLLSKHPSPHRD